jgi:hypothetical protein
MTAGNADSTRSEIEQAKLELDRYRAQLDHHNAMMDRHKAELDRYKAELDRFRAGFEAVIRFAELGIKSLLALNGGATLALLTFMGHVEKAQAAAGLGKALMFFGAGAAASVLTALLAYVTQAVIIETDDTKGWPAKPARWWGQALRALTVLVGVAGFAFFLWGLYIASQAVSMGANA